MSTPNTIERVISPAPFTGRPRKAIQTFFGITENLEMIQQLQVIHTDETGQPMHEVIDADESLTPAQRDLAKAQFPIRQVVKTTEDSFCDPATGLIVEEGDENAVPQLAFFQAITIGQMMALTGTTENDSFASALYAMLYNQIGIIDANGKL